MISNARKRIRQALAIPFLLVAWLSLGPLFIQPIAAQGLLPDQQDRQSLALQWRTTEQTAQKAQAHSLLQPATVARCSGHGCDWTNPYTTCCAGCSGDAWWVVLSAPLRDSHGYTGGWVQLWWSATCQTNWTRTVDWVNGWNTGTRIVDLWGGKHETINSQSLVVITDQFYLPYSPAAAAGWANAIGGDWYYGSVSQ